MPVETRRLKAVESSLVVRINASSLADRRAIAGICVVRHFSERVGPWVDIALIFLCAEVFRSVGRCEPVADTSRDRDWLDKNGGSRSTSW